MSAGGRWAVPKPNLRNSKKADLSDDIDEDITETVKLLSATMTDNFTSLDAAEDVAIITPTDQRDTPLDDIPVDPNHSITSNTAAEFQPKEAATPKFVYVLTFLSAIGGFLFGYDTGVVSGALFLVRIRFSLSPVWQEGIVSVTMASAAVFALISGVANDRFGRKPTIIVASGVFTAGALVLAAAQERFMLLIGRAILGIGIGLASSTVPMYIAECAPPEVRGRLVTINNFFITGGQFIAGLVAGAFSSNYETGWRFMFGLAAVPSIIQFVGFLFMPETPRWLVTRGQHDRARSVLHRIHGPQFDIEQEITDIQNTVEANRADDKEFVIVKMLKVSHVRRALIVGCLLQLFQQIVGINTVMYYSATIIGMSGIENVSTVIWLAAVTAAVNFIFSFVGLFFVERVGRRPLTLGSLAGALVSLIVLAVGFQLAAIHSPDVTVIEVTNGKMSLDLCSNYSSCDGCMTSTRCGFCYAGSPSSVLNGSCLPVPHDLNGDVIYGHSSYGRCNSSEPTLHWAFGYCPTPHAWMAVFGLVLYLMFFAPGMGPMPWTINSEIYPLWARSTGNSVTTCVNWVFNLIISMTFLSLTEAITRYGAFWLYAGFAAIGIVVLGVCLPETRGRRLEEVEQLFSRPLFSSFRSSSYRHMD